MEMTNNVKIGMYQNKVFQLAILNPSDIIIGNLSLAKFVHHYMATLPFN